MNEAKDGAGRHAEPDGHGDALRSETPFERADRNWNEILQEARVIQAGTQIIGGFLLAMAFQPRFEELDIYQLVIYLVLVTLAGFATALGLALVMMHRRLFGKRKKIEVVRAGNRLLIANMVVVAVLASLVTGLIFDFVLGHAAGLAAFGGCVLVTAGLWVFSSRLGARE